MKSQTKLYFKVLPQNEHDDDCSSPLRSVKRNSNLNEMENFYEHKQKLPSIAKM